MHASAGFRFPVDVDVMFLGQDGVKDLKKLNKNKKMVKKCRVARKMVPCRKLTMKTE